LCLVSRSTRCVVALEKGEWAEVQRSRADADFLAR
jgi:hypothetical protein